MPYEYNTLLKLNLQKKADLDPVEADIDDLKQKKVTKFFAATDTLEAGEIAQYQGPDDAVNGLKNGYFYNTSGQITIQTGTPFIEIPADIVGEFSTINQGRYYNTGVQSVIQLSHRSSIFNHVTYILIHLGGDADLPRVGDTLIKQAATYSENSIYYKITAVTWVSGNKYNLTLDNGNTLTLDFTTTGGNYYYLQEFSNNDSKVYLYNFQTFTSFSPILFADIENGNAPIFAPYIHYGTTDSEIIITAGYTQVDTQPGINGISNDEGGGVAISTDVTIAGNLTVQGTQTVVQTQEIDSESDNINLRYNNPLALADGEESGVKVLNYDGNNTNCFLGVDNQGWARVGDEGGTLQKLATIEENPTDGEFVKYNTTTKQLESGTIPTPSEATTTSAGLMSAADKVKLDNLSVSAVTSYTKSNSTFKFYKYGRLVNVFIICNSTSSSPISFTIDAAFAPLEHVGAYGVPFMSSGNCSLEIEGTTLSFIGKGAICLSYLAAS